MSVYVSLCPDLRNNQTVVNISETGEEITVYIILSEKQQGSCQGRDLDEYISNSLASGINMNQQPHVSHCVAAESISKSQCVWLISY